MLFLLQCSESRDGATAELKRNSYQKIIYQFQQQQQKEILNKTSKEYEKKVKMTDIWENCRKLSHININDRNKQINKQQKAKTKTKNKKTKQTKNRQK